MNTPVGRETSLIVVEFINNCVHNNETESKIRNILNQLTFRNNHCSYFYFIHKLV